MNTLPFLGHPALQRARRMSIVVVASLALLMTGCAGDNSAEAPNESGLVPISMGTQPWIGYGQWYVAEEQGIFDDLGLDVETVMLNSDADKTSAFVSGQINSVNLATHTAMMLREQGVPLKIVAIEDYSTTADAMLAGPGVTSISDLAGKSIAYEQGATSDLLLQSALKEAGLTMQDITPVPMAASDAGTALIAGQVDVAITYEPYISTATAEDASLTTIYDGSDAPGLISDVLAVDESLINENPETVQALVDAWGQAVDSYNDDPAAAREIIAKGIDQDPAELTTAFEGVQYFDLDQNAEEFSGSYVNEVLPMAESAATEAGLLSEPVDLDALYDSQFVEK